MATIGKYVEPGIGPAQIVIGTWKPIPENDPYVKEMAEFAVKEHGENLTFKSVETGQIVEVFLDGNNYYNLLILAQPLRSLQGFYSTIVLVNTSKKLKKLISFVPLP